MDAAQQGWFDGLCGIYAIVNSVSKVACLSYDERQELFNQLIRDVEKKRSLRNVVLGGIPRDTLVYLLNKAKEYISINMSKQISSPLIASEAGNINGIWKKMCEFMKEQENRAILLGLSNKHDHWTAVEAISPRSMKLLDSGGLKRINKSNVNTSEYTPKIHLIDKKNIWGLYLKK